MVDRPPVLGARDVAVLQAVAAELIPASGAMPSAGDAVTGRRLEFVLTARPDLAAPLSAALDELGAPRDPGLDVLSTESRAVIELVIVGAYYSDADVQRALGYPGQEARPVNPFDYPEYLDEGLIDRVVERGPIWRDPDA